MRINDKALTKSYIYFTVEMTKFDLLTFGRFELVYMAA
jgi:hypothetical protein